MVLLQTAAAGNTLSTDGMACDESLEVLKVKVATKTCRGVGKFQFDVADCEWCEEDDFISSNQSCKYLYRRINQDHNKILKENQ